MVVTCIVVHWYSITNLTLSLYSITMTNAYCDMSKKWGVLLYCDCTYQEWMQCTEVYIISRLCRHRYWLTLLICPDNSCIKFAIWGCSIRISRSCCMKSVIFVIPRYRSTRRYSDLVWFVALTTGG